MDSDGDYRNSAWVSGCNKGSRETANRIWNAQRRSILKCIVTVTVSWEGSLPCTFGLSVQHRRCDGFSVLQI